MFLDYLDRVHEVEQQYYRGFNFKKEKNMDFVYAVKRIEDLGVLKERLSSLADHSVFRAFVGIGCGRAKAATEVFFNMTPNLQEEFIHRLAYELEEALDLVCQCYHIASGEREE